LARILCQRAAVSTGVRSGLPAPVSSRARRDLSGALFRCCQRALVSHQRHSIEATGLQASGPQTNGPQTSGVQTSGKQAGGKQASTRVPPAPFRQVGSARQPALARKRLPL